MEKLSRKNARDILFKLIFELQFLNPDETTAFEDLMNDETIDSDSKNFIKTNLQAMIDHKEEIMDLIGKNLTNYTIDRIFKVDLAILIMATTELKFINEIDKKIIINEAVEFAKKYSTSKSPSFVNGVLSKIIG